MLNTAKPAQVDGAANGKSSGPFALPASELRKLAKLQEAVGDDGDELQELASIVRLAALAIEAKRVCQCVQQVVRHREDIAPVLAEWVPGLNRWELLEDTSTDVLEWAAIRLAKIHGRTEATFEALGGIVGQCEEVVS